MAHEHTNRLESHTIVDDDGLAWRSFDHKEMMHHVDAIYGQLKKQIRLHYVGQDNIDRDEALAYGYTLAMFLSSRLFLLEPAIAVANADLFCQQLKGEIDNALRSNESARHEVSSGTSIDTKRPIYSS